MYYLLFNNVIQTTRIYRALIAYTFNLTQYNCTVFCFFFFEGRFWSTWQPSQSWLFPFQPKKEENKKTCTD